MAEALVREESALLTANAQNLAVSFASRAFRPRSVRHFHHESPSATTPDAMFDSL